MNFRPIAGKPLLCALFVALSSWLLLTGPSAAAQVETATLEGTVTDPQGAVIPQAQVTITNIATGAERNTATNTSGDFSIVGLVPGTYQLHVEHSGFKASDVKGIVLSVASRQTIPIHLAVGSEAQTVTVEGSDLELLTTSPAVSTVVNQEEVANMPLNGRSFQDLMLMAPGATSVNPELGESEGQSGRENGISQITVNGDTGYSNSYTVDGVSANFGAGNGGGFIGVGGGGGLPAQTILGTTQSMVPVDDLQEFRVETSGYPAEFGGYSGGQFVFVTRSGTNEFHGSASDYYRDTIFDANDWFNNYFGMPRQPLHQNDFSGTIGGPVWIPHVFNGKNKSYFFFDYEGLRANLPIAAFQQYAPDAALVASATGIIQQWLASLPKPNGPDYGDGLASYVTGYSSPNDLNTYSLRLDELLSSKEELFARASNTLSSTTTHYYGGTNPLQQNTRTYTAGLTSAFTEKITNQLRANFSLNAGTQMGVQTPQPGQPTFNTITAGGYPATQATALVFMGFYPSKGDIYAEDFRGINETRQLDLPDNVAWVVGDHQLKFGVDFRRLTSSGFPESPLGLYEWYSSATLLANTLDYGANYSYAFTSPSIVSFAAYAEDQWRATKRLTLSYGLRWEDTPPPTERRGGMPFTLINQNDPATIALGPSGRPYNPYYYDFAPRFGATYLVRSTPGYETQIRGGVGVFYDAAANQGNSLLGLNSPGFTGENSFCPYSYCSYQGTYSFPLPEQYRYTPIQYPPVPPFTETYDAVDPHFTNPYAIQANFAIQQDLGKNNAITLNYVGAFYRKGIEYIEEYINPVNPNFQFVEFEKNGLRSVYNSGQLVFQHRINNGLYAYAGYTWSHAIGQNQINPFTPYEKGNTSGDLRNNFNAVVTWNSPYKTNNHVAEAILAHWGLDVLFTARTGFPITLYGPTTSDAADGGTSVEPGLNFVANQPSYIYGSYNGAKIPDGRQLNPAAFTAAPVGVNGTVPINYFRGFGMDQWNVAVRRDFAVYRTLHLQFRAESFNLVNHENYGVIDDYLPDVNFGQATGSLAGALAPGDTSPQYQDGGPRNLQLALKLLF